MINSHIEQEKNIINEHYKMMRFQIFHLLNIQLSSEDKLHKLTDLFYIGDEKELEEEQLQNVDLEIINNKMDEMLKIINH